MDEMLVSAVQERPCLYNTQLHNYRNKGKKENAWLEVAALVNMDVDECMRRWKGLRDKYNRELKKVRNGSTSGSAAQSRNEWEFLKLMQFLDPHTKPRSTISNLDLTNPEGEYVLELSPAADNVSSANISAVCETKESSVLIGKKRKREKSNNSDHLDEVISLLKADNSEPPDPDMSFLASLLPELKQLEPNKKSLLKLKIFQLVHETVYE